VSFWISNNGLPQTKELTLETPNLAAAFALSSIAARSSAEPFSFVTCQLSYWISNNGLPQTKELTLVMLILLALL